MHYTEENQDRMKTFAVAMIQASLAKAEEGDVFEIAWLSSTSAQLWLDIVDIPQSSMLARTGWMDWALTVPAESQYYPVVQTSLAYMKRFFNGR